MSEERIEFCFKLRQTTKPRSFAELDLYRVFAGAATVESVPVLMRHHVYVKVSESAFVSVEAMGKTTDSVAEYNPDWMVYPLYS